MLSDPEASRIPVLRPRLPSAELLLPYLRRIDEARIYSNWGPLGAEFAHRLAAGFGLPDGSVVSAASGTLALLGAILGVSRGTGASERLAIIPAFTFAATAAAVEQAGYRGYLADVDPESWTLDPERLLAEMDPAVLAEAALVVPVAAFGRPVPQAPWRAFQEKTGIPVVIDGAAAFEGLMRRPNVGLGEIPVAISLHATKSLAVGEGGCVVSTNGKLADRITQALNYGFLGTRESLVRGTNGKMSEYHAAVGLAALDGWWEQQVALRHSVADKYRLLLAEHGQLRRLTAAPQVCSSYALLSCSSPAQADDVQDALSDDNIDFRLWYGAGVHRHLHYSDLPRESHLTVTDGLASRLMGLPMAEDLSDLQIQRVVAAVAQGLARTAASSGPP